MGADGHLFPELMDPRQLAGPVLVIVPHPDDEVIGCGGMMAHHVGAGHTVRVVHATDGAAGDPEGRYTDLAARRAEELSRALAVLGVTHWSSLGYADGTLAAAEDLAERLGAVLREARPKTVYTLSPLDNHQDHRVLARAAIAALAAHDEPDLTCMVTGINNLGLPNTLVDITGVQELKERALRCFESQLSYIDFATKVVWRDRAATVNIEDTSVEACETYMRLPASRLADFLAAADALEAILYGR